MEPTFHCAESSGQGCMGSYNDRVIANRFIYHFRDPKRGDIVVFDPPADVVSACGAGGHLREAHHRTAGRRDLAA